MMALKKICLALLYSVLLAGWTSAQDTTDTSQGTYFLSFVKKVYFNPTILLATQDFHEQHNVRVLVLPDLNGAEENQITGFERGMQKIIRFLIEGDDEGSVRFYFDGGDAETPFSFVCAEELWCKFTTEDKDSIEYYLNAPFQNAEYDLNSHALFEASIEGALDYVGKCLQQMSAQCGEMPDHATNQINTRPLSISLHTTSGTKYDIDYKYFGLLESHYAKAHDVFTDQDWYAPSKFMVAGGTSSEPVAVAIDKHETLFKKQNLVFRTVYNNQVIPIDPSSTNDTIKLLLPKELPSGNPVEVVVKYTSTLDSLQYTVGFFMVHVFEPKEVKLNLLAANGYTIDEAAISNALKTVYDPVGVHFTIEKKEWMPDSGWPLQIAIESSGLLSNYPPDLRDWVDGVQDLNDYDDEEYYLIFGLNTTSLAGYMPRARNVGFVFSNSPNAGKTAAHELGHGVHHLRHIFADEELGPGEYGNTGNIMDYGLFPKELYLHQWKLIDDPSSVSWFGGDDEEAAVEGQVPFRCVPSLIAKKYQEENYLNMSGDIVKLKEGQIPDIFVGSPSPYAGRIIRIYDANLNRMYYSAKDNVNYPHYYSLKSGGAYINKEDYIVLTKCPGQQYTKVKVEDNCNYIIERHDEPDATGKLDDCKCTKQETPSNSGNTQPNILTRHTIQGTQNTFTSGFNNQECRWFTLANGNFGKLSQNQLSTISAVKLIGDKDVVAFKNHNDELFELAYWADKDESDVFSVTSGSYYYTCFECLEADSTIVNGTHPLIKRYVSNGKIYYKGIPSDSHYLLEIKEENRKPYEEDALVWSKGENGHIVCDEAVMTLQYLEASIMNCNLIAACMVSKLMMLDSATLAAFRPGTREHIRDYLFTNVWIQSPSTSDEYAFLDFTIDGDKYLLLELIKVMKVKNEFKSFVEGYLLNSSNGRMPLARLITGNSNIEFRFLIVNEIATYLQQNNKNYLSPNTPITQFDGTVTQVPNNANTLFIYYENWFQASNEYIVHTPQNKVLVTTDEFSFHFYESKMHIAQMGDMAYYAKEPFLDIEDPGTPLFTSSYNDEYNLHPYSIVPVVFGKAFNELQIQEGQRALMPAFMAALFAQIGAEKASQQNQAIAIGTIAVLTSVFTAGQSLWATGAFATTLSTVTTITTVTVSSASAVYNTMDVQNLLNEGTSNLTPAQMEEQNRVRKIAGYLAMAECAIGLHSLLKSTLVELKAYQAFKNTLNTAIDYSLSYVSSFFKLSKIRNVGSTYYFAMALSASSLNPLLIKSTSAATVIENVVQLEGSTTKFATGTLATEMNHSVSSLDNMVTSGAAYKLPNVNYKTYQVSTPTVSFVENSSQIVENAFQVAPVLKVNLYIIRHEQKDIIYAVNAQNQSIANVMAYDPQGNTYKKDPEPECTACTAYSQALCFKFKTLKDKLPVSEKTLVTKLCGQLLLNNVSPVLNYLNSGTNTLRTKWYNDLNTGTTTDYLGKHIPQLNAKVIEAWNMMNAAKSPEPNQASAFRYDWKSIDALRQLLDVQATVNNLGGAENLQKMIKENIRAKCTVCGSGGSSLINPMDKFIADLNYFGSHFTNATGRSNVNSLLMTTQMRTREAEYYILKVINNNQVLFSNITAFECTDLVGCEPDVVNNGVYCEFKSWSNIPSGETVDKDDPDVATSSSGAFSYFKGSPTGNSFKQFKALLSATQVTSMANINYYFDAEKLAGVDNTVKATWVKGVFKDMMYSALLNSNSGGLTAMGEQVFEAIWSNSNLRASLFPSITDFNSPNAEELGEGLFTTMVSSVSNSFYNFVQVK